jgi:hypothetical protein
MSSRADQDGVLRLDRILDCPATLGHHPGVQLLDQQLAMGCRRPGQLREYPVGHFVGQIHQQPFDQPHRWLPRIESRLLQLAVPIRCQVGTDAVPAAVPSRYALSAPP